MESERSRGKFLVIASEPELVNVDLSPYANIEKIRDGQEWLIADLSSDQFAGVGEPFFVLRGIRDDTGNLQGIVGADQRAVVEYHVWVRRHFRMFRAHVGACRVAPPVQTPKPATPEHARFLRP